MYEMRSDNSGIEEALVLSEELEAQHKNPGMLEGKLFYKGKYKLVPKGKLKSLPERLKIAADLEEFESESGRCLTDSLVCFIGIDVPGYRSVLFEDYENVCEIARLYAEDHNTAVFVVPHFKENYAGKFAMKPAHVHILYHPVDEKFEDYIEQFSERFEDNEK